MKAAAMSSEEFEQNKLDPPLKDTTIPQVLTTLEQTTAI
jgi:hypothetical protein